MTAVATYTSSALLRADLHCTCFGTIKQPLHTLATTLFRNAALNLTYTVAYLLQLRMFVCIMCVWRRCRRIAACSGGIPVRRCSKRMASCCDGGGRVPLISHGFKQKQQAHNPLLEYIARREAGHAVALSYW